MFGCASSSSCFGSCLGSPGDGFRRGSLKLVTATSAAAPWPARVVVPQSDAEAAPLVEEELSDDETSSGASRPTVVSGKHRRHKDGSGGRALSLKNWRTPYGQPFGLPLGALCGGLLRGGFVQQHKFNGREVGGEIDERGLCADRRRRQRLGGNPGATASGACWVYLSTAVPSTACAPRRQRLCRDARHHCQRRLLGIPLHGGTGPAPNQLNDRDRHAAQGQKGGPDNNAAWPPKMNRVCPAVSVWTVCIPAADRTMLKSSAVSNLVRCCPPAPGKRYAPGSVLANRRICRSAEHQGTAGARQPWQRRFGGGPGPGCSAQVGADRHPKAVFLVPQCGVEAPAPSTTTPPRTTTPRRRSADARQRSPSRAGSLSPGPTRRSGTAGIRSKLTNAEIAEIQRNLPPDYRQYKDRMHRRGAVSEDAPPQSVRHLRRETVEDIIAVDEAAAAGDTASQPKLPPLSAQTFGGYWFCRRLPEGFLGHQCAVCAGLRAPWD
ncbi:hypothetical protein AK812_SmicGene27263 [Symbiodinium microadriaticum]|uniref:Uncharacterized protein n=1 Tax=Symbiodinium microadriaticum TaxID=2951 RepID=A0A1Q9D7E9_SYMMI|nr:hypothetical protein AK812_SmicGene27263 [Symbiodinium microadriaticum]